LAREKDQLASQLVSRLVPATGANIARLLHDIRSSGMLAPTRVPYLSPPGAEVRRCESHLDMITAFGVTPDCRLVLSANGLTDYPNFWQGATISVWDIETGTELRRLDAHTETVAAVEV